MWNTGVISPIYKKGEKSDVRNYTGYLQNICEHINEKLKKEVEQKLEGQFGFREGRCAIDATYVLNHVMNRELTKKKGKKIFAFFMTLRAVFKKWTQRN